MIVALEAQYFLDHTNSTIRHEGGQETAICKCLYSEGQRVIDQSIGTEGCPPA